jgi:hypothetical protein
MDSHSRAGGNPFDTLQLDPRVRGDDTAESFQTTASRLAGLAGVLLGWRPGEFWGATPAELLCVLQALDGGETVTGAGMSDVARLMEMFPDG